MDSLRGPGAQPCTMPPARASHVQRPKPGAGSCLMNVPVCLMRKSVTRLHPAILDRIIPAAVSQALHARLASLLAIQTVNASCYAARGLDRHSCSITLCLGRATLQPIQRAGQRQQRPTRPRARQYLSGNHHAKGTLKINSESVSCLFISVYRSVLS